MMDILSGALTGSHTGSRVRGPYEADNPVAQGICSSPSTSPRWDPPRTTSTPSANSSTKSNHTAGSRRRRNLLPRRTRRPRRTPQPHRRRHRPTRPDPHRPRNPRHRPRHHRDLLTAASRRRDAVASALLHTIAELAPPGRTRSGAHRLADPWRCTDIGTTIEVSGFAQACASRDASAPARKCAVSRDVTGAGPGWWPARG